jgi:hypothetical protein
MRQVKWGALGSWKGVFDAVMFLMLFGVVEAIQRADKVARNASDALERMITKIIADFHFVSVYGQIHRLGFHTEFFRRAAYVSVDLSLGDISTM